MVMRDTSPLYLVVLIQQRKALPQLTSDACYQQSLPVMRGLQIGVGGFEATQGCSRETACELGLWEAGLPPDHLGSGHLGSCKLPAHFHLNI